MPENRKHKMLTLHPDYRNNGTRYGIKPSFLSSKLKQRFDIADDDTSVRNTRTTSVMPPPVQQTFNDEPLPEVYTDTEFRTVGRNDITNNVPRSRPFCLVNNQAARKASREIL